MLKFREWDIGLFFIFCKKYYFILSISSNGENSFNGIKTFTIVLIVMTYSNTRINPGFQIARKR